MISLQLLFFSPSSLIFSQILTGRVVKCKLAKAKASDTTRSINYYLTNNFIYISCTIINKDYEPPISRSFLPFTSHEIRIFEGEIKKMIKKTETL